MLKNEEGVNRPLGALEIVATVVICLTGPAVVAISYLFAGSVGASWALAAALLASVIMVSTDEDYVNGEIGIAATFAALGFPIAALVLAWRFLRLLFDSVWSDDDEEDEEDFAPTPATLPAGCSSLSVPWAEGEPPKDGKFYVIMFDYEGPSALGVARWVSSEIRDAFQDGTGAPYVIANISHYLPMAITQPKSLKEKICED